jgi:hypothetical protein
MDYKSILEEGSGKNEDLFEVIPERNMAWVIDGRSGLSDRQLFPNAPSDGRWFVNRINSYIVSSLGDSMSLKNLIRYSIRETTLDAVDEMSYSGHPKSNEFEDIDDTLSTSDLPAATISIVNWGGETIDTLSLGDCGVAVSKTGGTSYITQGDPSQYDNLNEEWINGEEDVSIEEYKKRLREERKRQQIPGGYWVVGFNPIAADFAIEESYYKNSVNSILLTTDGFSPIVNKYELYGNWNKVLQKIRLTSMQTLVNELREYEENEADGITETHDDIAAVYLNI